MKDKKQQQQNDPTKRSGRRDPKVYVLIAIAVLAVGSIAYQTFRPRTPEAVSSAPSLKPVKSGPGGKMVDPINSTDEALNFEVLNEAPVVFNAEARNVFSFHVAAPAPTPQQLANAGGPGQEGEATPPPPPPPPAPVCGDGTCNGGERYETCPADCPPVLQPITLKYIGYIGYAKETSGPVAFLTDGKEVFMGKVNDVIANKYKVISITDQSVELGYVNLPANYSKSIPFEAGNTKS